MLRHLRLVSVFAAAIALAAMFLATRRAIAILIELDSPSVAFRKDYPEPARQKVLAALRADGAKFIRGSGLNSFTQLHYSGDTKALNGFLDQLANCPDVVISVRFYRPGPDAGWAPEGSQWSVFHMAGKNQFDVRINLSSKSVELDKLYIPPINGA